MMEGNAALRIAITGANGNLGRKLIAAFLAAPDIAAIHAIDRDVAGLSPHDARLFPIQADLLGSGLLNALAGMDVVIHLAAQNPYPDASWEDASASFDMTAKLVEACAKAGLSRVVFASSNHVMGGYKDTPVAVSDGGLSTDLPPLVGTLVKTSEGLIDSTAYAAAKLMGERVVAVKAEAGAFSAVLLRIGWCQPGENTPQTISAAGTPKSGLIETDPEREHDLRWFRAMWLSNGDLIRCVLRLAR
jgi:nucleoside-diphosphate-sugar epimerase